MPSVLEVDVPTPPSSAGAAQVSQSWLPKAGATVLSPSTRRPPPARQGRAQSAAAVKSADEIDDDDFATS